MIIKYFKSKDIKVFPCQNRGTIISSYDANSIIGIQDPEARMLSEYNLTHIADNNCETFAIGFKDRKWKASDGTNQVFAFVLHGYYFEVLYTDTDDGTSSLLKNKVLAIKLNDYEIPTTNLSEGDKNRSYALGAITEGTATYTMLDTYDTNKVSHFIGLASIELEESETINTIKNKWGTGYTIVACEKFLTTSGNIIPETLRPEIIHGTGSRATVLGYNEASMASGTNAIAAGESTTASGTDAIAIGKSTVAEKETSVAIGDTTKASGKGAFSSGYYTKAKGDYSRAEGAGLNGTSGGTDNIYTEAIGYATHAEGYGTKADGHYCHTEGGQTETQKIDSNTSTYYAHAEGFNTVAKNNCAHSEGKCTIASGYSSHAEGYLTQATGEYAHSEGTGELKTDENNNDTDIYNIASGIGSHAEGYCATASGDYAHSEGKSTKATGEAAHAAGQDTKASGAASYAGGLGTTADKDYQTVIGKYNKTEVDSLFTIGNGTATASSNALTVDASNINLYNNTTIGTTNTNNNLTVNGNILTGQITTLKGKNIATSVLNTADNYGDLIVLGGDSNGGGSVAICAGESGYNYYTGATHTKLNVNDEYIHLAADSGVYCFTGVNNGMTDNTQPTLTLYPNGTLYLGSYLGGGGAKMPSLPNKDAKYQSGYRGTHIYSDGILFSDPGTTPGPNGTNGTNGETTNSDFGWIRHIETTRNSGELEIATGDDGNESENIVFRGYSSAGDTPQERYKITVPHMSGKMAVIGSQITGYCNMNGGYIRESYQSTTELILPSGLYYVRLGNVVGGGSSDFWYSMGILLVSGYYGTYYVGSTGTFSMKVTGMFYDSAKNGYKINTASWDGSAVDRQVHFTPLGLV